MLDIFYKVLNFPIHLETFRTFYGATGCPSQAGQTLHIEYPSSKVAGRILPITYRVPQSLVDLDILEWLLV